MDPLIKMPTLHLMFADTQFADILAGRKTATIRPGFLPAAPNQLLQCHSVSGAATNQMRIVEVYHGPVSHLSFQQLRRAAPNVVSPYTPTPTAREKVRALLKELSGQPVSFADSVTYIYWTPPRGFSDEE